MFYIATDETYYVTYINFDELIWEEHYWIDDFMLGAIEWEFQNTEWNNAARNTWSKVDSVSKIGCTIDV